MTWTPSTPSLPPGSGRPTPTSARSTGSSPPPTPESSSATYTQTLRGDGLLGVVGRARRLRITLRLEVRGEFRRLQLQGDVAGLRVLGPGRRHGGGLPH